MKVEGFRVQVCLQGKDLALHLRHTLGHRAESLPFRQTLGRTANPKPCHNIHTIHVPIFPTTVCRCSGNVAQVVREAWVEIRLRSVRVACGWLARAWAATNRRIGRVLGAQRGVGGRWPQLGLRVGLRLVNVMASVRGRVRLTFAHTRTLNTRRTPCHAHYPPLHSRQLLLNTRTHRFAGEEQSVFGHTQRAHVQQLPPRHARMRTRILRAHIMYTFACAYSVEC